MRLFIALEFPADIKKELRNGAELMRAFCDDGNFTFEENYHITLVFIGEVENKKIQLIKSVMDECVTEENIAVAVNNAGKFGKGDGEILIRYAKCAEKVFNVHDSICEKLGSNGFSFDSKPFKPHITIARKARFKTPDAIKKINEVIKPLSFNAKSVSLMRSDRINGKLTYTPVYSKPLSR